MVKEVTDCDNLPSDKTRHNGSNSACPDQTTFFTFVNHGMYSKKISGASKHHPHQNRKSLTWRAGPSSGTGNVSSQIDMYLHVKKTVRKMCRRHGATHDFDTREQDKREGLESCESSSVVR